MHQSDFHSQYSYNPQQAYVAPKRGFVEKVFGDKAARVIKSPLFATAGLLLAGAAIAAIVVTAYPENGQDGTVPIVQADARPFKTAPIEAGGMDIPNSESTIFETLQSADAGKTGRRIENLLDVPAVEPAAGDAEESVMEMAEAPTAVAKPAEKPMEPKQAGLKKPALETAPTVQAAKAQPPATIHTPGSSPETLAFVRSVLDSGEQSGTASVNRDQQPSARALNDVAPAAGAAAPAAATPAGGSYFVQLVSITDEAAAPKEWGKLQASYSGILTNADYRVQRADLGERGIYYRIQAGPYSKEQASSICGAITAQKPGGCLVTK